MQTSAIIFTLCVAGIFTSSAVEISEEQHKMFDSFEQECLAETKLEAAVIEEAKKSRKIEFDEKTNCFFACMFKKIGFINDEGVFDEDMSRALLSENIDKEILDAAITNCKNEVGKDACETVGKLMACFIKNKATLE